jgi:hypothetical protein
MTPLALMTHRFRDRLRSALDRLGFSPHLQHRSRTLALHLGIHESEAFGMLNGDLLPDYAVLVALSQHLEKPIGWFLDANGASLPATTKIVHSIGPGEDIAIALPEDLSGSAVKFDDALLYFRSGGEMGFGVKGGDYLIVLEVAVQPMSVSKDQIYLLGCKTGFELRRCVTQSPLRASFQSFDGKTKNTLKPTIAEADFRDSDFETDTLCPGMHHFSVVVAVLKSPKNMPKDGGEFLFGT